MSFMLQLQLTNLSCASCASSAAAAFARVAGVHSARVNVAINAAEVSWSRGYFGCMCKRVGAAHAAALYIYLHARKLCQVLQQPEQ